MKYMKEILALLVLILLVVVYFYLNNNTVEGLGDKKDLSEIQKQADKDAKGYIKDQQTHFGARKLDTLDEGAYGDTVFLKVSEDKTKTNYEDGTLGLERDYSAYDKPKSEYEKRVKKCKDINRLKSCSLLEDAYEDGTGCGYCLDSNMIIYGGQSAPADPDNPGKFSPDVCGGGGSKNTWIPPGPNVAFECQKAKDRAYCSKMKDCGDTSVADRCAWCPISGKGFAKKENKDGGWEPKYKDDKCEWPYEGIKTTVKWYGADHKKYGDLDIGRGSCKKDTDCAPGLKCGQNPHKTKNTLGLKGENSKFGKGQDYCYDPEFAGMNGPLVPVGECAKFGQRFPCMGPQMLTGPHSEACFQDLWKKSGCRGKVMNRLSEQGSWGSKLAKMWNATGYTNVMKSMMGLNTDMESKDYATAKRATKVCKGVDVDACEDRFVNESKKVKRPLDCLVNLYNQSGCSKDGRLHPNNITKTVSDDARKKHGVKKEWELGTFYRWKPQDYLNKLKGVKQRANKLTTASNVDTYDEGIKLYENCYGKPPPTSTFPKKKPCWKDFCEIMKRSHKNVVISKDEQRIVYNKDSLGVQNAFMKDSNLNRTRMAGEGKTGHDWGNSKTIKKADYDKPYFPFWRFIRNSRSIYQGAVTVQKEGKVPSGQLLTQNECRKYYNQINDGSLTYGNLGANRNRPKGCYRHNNHVRYSSAGTLDCKTENRGCLKRTGKGLSVTSRWSDFKKRMLKINGVQDLGDDTLLCAPFMGVGRTLRNYKLAKKKSLAHIPTNGKCDSCSLVPSGQCQEGCPKSSTPDGSRNACANRNKGKKPSTCTVPFGNVITKKMWMKADFPYWEFMRILQRFEKN
jgi:hypothetical protein